MSVFVEAIDDLFADDNLTSPAFHRAGGSGPEKTVRVIFVGPTFEAAFGETGLTAREITASVRLSEIPKPKRGDTLEVDDVIYRVEQVLTDSTGATARLALSKL